MASFSGMPWMHVFIAIVAIAVGTSCRPRDNDDRSQVLANTGPAAPALDIIKAKCAGCHDQTATVVKTWVIQYLEANKKCFTTANATAKAKTECLKPLEIGFLRAGVPTSAFKNSLGHGAGDAAIINFISNNKMPASNDPALTEQEWNTLKTWLDAGATGVDEYFGAVVAGAIPLSECTDTVSPSLKTHIKKRDQVNWSRNLFSRVDFKSFGCPSTLNRDYARDPITSAQACFSDKPASDWALDSSFKYPSHLAGEWVTLNSKVVKIRELPYKTYYWMRSSADGRWVGNGFKGYYDGRDNPCGSGTGYEAVIEDLNKAESETLSQVFVAAQYDPGFYPNNSGFSFHGVSAETKLAMCNINLLTNNSDQCLDLNATSGPEAKYCSTSAQAGVYQHIGSSLEGRDTFVVRGTYANDNAAFAVIEDAPTGKFGKQDAHVDIFNYAADATGDKKIVKEAWRIAKPFNGDWIISPSADLLVSRVSGPESFKENGVMQGYNIQTLTFSGGKPQLASVGRVCLRGDKAGVSFNERIIATHHNVAAEDQGELGKEAMSQDEFKSKYVKNSANIYIQDLCTGKKARITDMGPGEFAVFPHFRADGWLYFMVRDKSTEKNYVAASDAALEMQKTPCGS